MPTPHGSHLTAGDHGDDEAHELPLTAIREQIAAALISLFTKGDLEMVVVGLPRSVG